MWSGFKFTKLKDGDKTNKTALFAAIRPFGILRSRLPLLQRLTQAGWQVIVATVEDSHAPALRQAGFHLENANFTRGGISPIADLLALKRMVQLIREHQPALIHLFHAKPILIGSLSALPYPAGKVVVSITGLGHGFYGGKWLARIYAKAFRVCLLRADVVTFQNSNDLFHFKSQKIVPPYKTRLIKGSGVDLEIFKPTSCEERDDHNLTVLMASRLHWQKGVREYVEAARLVRASSSNVRFQLAGEWDEQHPDGVRREWQEQLERAGVEFLGYIEDMPQYLPRVDILVHPSYGEGMPRIVLEASACGLPVITTHAPGCREAVLDGITGMLVPVKDSQALAQAILTLTSDAELRRRLGESGRAFVEEHFDIHKITQQTMQIYRELGLSVDL